MQLNITIRLAVCINADNLPKDIEQRADEITKRIKAIITEDPIYVEEIEDLDWELAPSELTKLCPHPRLP